MVFEDIFSKKEIAIEEKPKIIVDYREKNSLVISELIKQKCEIEFKQLEIGDYIINDTIIERKTFQDLLSSIINKRIFTQIANLKTIENKMVIIEGIEEYLYNSRNQRLNENAIKGFLISILINHKIPLLFSKDCEDTAKILKLIAKKSDKNKSSIKLEKIPKTEKEKIIFIIGNFEGIGQKTAVKLLEEFKTIKNIINAPKEQLEKVIGKKSESFEIVNLNF